MSDLIDAVRDNDAERVRALLKEGADPNERDEMGMPALMIAACYGHTECVKALLEGGANPNIQSNNGETALMEAANNGHMECVRALLEGGARSDANVQERRRMVGETALMLAASQGNAECVKLLLEAGANPDTKDSNGKTALDYAKTDEIRKLLQEHERGE